MIEGDQLIGIKTENESKDLIYRIDKPYATPNS